MPKYNFDEVVDRKGSYCTQWDFVEDRFGKQGMIPFTISDSDFRVLPEISERLKQQVEHGIYGYTRWNHADYKNAIVRWYAEMHQTTIDAELIIYGPSVMYMIKRLLDFWSTKGDGIITFSPMYDGFIKLISGLNRVIEPLEMDAVNYAIDWEKFTKICSKTRSKVLLLCNPLNPIGKAFTEQELRKIVEICKKHGVRIISDDIHMDYVYAPSVYTPIIPIAAEFAYSDNVALVTSPSKTFNTAGLMGAFMLLPNAELREQYLEYLRNVDCLSSAPIMGVVALITAYNDGDIWVKEMRAYLMATFRYIENFIHVHELPIIFRIPEATYFAWFDMRNFGLSRADIQERLIAKNIAIMDGSIYTLGEDNTLRLNIAAPRSKVVQAMEAIAAIYQE